MDRQKDDSDFMERYPTNIERPTYMEAPYTETKALQKWLVN